MVIPFIVERLPRLCVEFTLHLDLPWLHLLRFYLAYSTIHSSLSFVPLLSIAGLTTGIAVSVATGVLFVQLVSSASNEMKVS